MKEKGYKTEQEEFWAGDFGREYISRNQGSALLASNLAFFSKALARAHDTASCVEFGANIGMNLKALNLLFPEMLRYGIEINSDAAAELEHTIGHENVIHGSILEVDPPRCDLVLIKGVLIHVNPDALQTVYEKLVNSTRRFLLIAEYYNPSPVEVNYRGNNDRLFKRDFAGEVLDRYPEMSLVDYGFVYHRDPLFPQDDVTWFLLEKTNVLGS